MPSMHASSSADSSQTRRPARWWAVSRSRFVLVALVATAALVVTVVALPGTVAAQAAAGPLRQLQAAGWLQRGPVANADPQALSSGEASFLDTTWPHRERLSRLYTALQEYQRLADEGKLDQVEGNGLRALNYQFSAAQQAFTGPAPSTRFERYVQTIRQATENGRDASDLLLRAQHAARNEDRAAPIGSARSLVGAGRRSQQDADGLLTTIVPAAHAP